jgi:uncharacterized protein
MTSLVFPDINVWLALAAEGHVHHPQARHWFERLDGVEPIFCRLTQLGLLRLLTTSAVMGAAVLSQRGAWEIYDKFLKREARFFEEPEDLDHTFRRLTTHASSSPKEWADAYLHAFAQEAGATLVTFDKALAARSKGLCLL